MISRSAQNAVTQSHEWVSGKDGTIYLSDIIHQTDGRMTAGECFTYLSQCEWMKNAIVCCFLGKTILVRMKKKNQCNQNKEQQNS